MSDAARSEERERVEWTSRNCPICGGAGQMIVFHHKHTGNRFVTIATERNGEVIETPIPAEVTAHCICELGRWMRSKTTEALKARIPDGAAIAESQSNWLFQPPGTEPEERYQTPTRAAIARRFGKIPETTT
jgi:hypothetical protein